jgi:hypothetical protein
MLNRYVPPRQNWTNEGRSSPLNPATGTPLAELPPSTIRTGSAAGAHKRQSSGDNYYEDVDPRFALAEQTQPEPKAIMPAALAPGYGSSASLQGQGQPHGEQGLINRNLRVGTGPQHGGPSRLDGSHSYEDLHTLSRSPAESDRSNFTSVSQRGVNPRWQPGPGQGGPGGFGGPGGQRRAPPPRTTDVLLGGNPDFELNLPGGRGRGGRIGPTGGNGRFTPSQGRQGMGSRGPYDQPGSAL